MNLTLTKKFKSRHLKSKTYNDLNELKRVFDDLPEEEKLRIAKFALEKYKSNKAELNKFRARNNDEKLYDNWQIPTYPWLLLTIADFVVPIAAMIHEKDIGLLPICIFTWITVPGLFAIDGCLFDDCSIRIDKHPIKLHKERKLESTIDNLYRMVRFLENKGYLELSDKQSDEYVVVDKNVSDKQIDTNQKQQDVTVDKNNQVKDEPPKVVDATPLNENNFGKAE